ncbi:hypothetical protein [Janthinobacterium rivuli]|uniref:HORMA-1 domain-containing protein n=1 Tax=Janthinobacterium TaxID=29580 RepID=UPI00383A776B
MSTSYTASSSYTVADIEKVVSRFSADLLMIADSTKALSQEKARTYARDVERLVKNGYLESVDVTLLDYFGTELRAVTYHVDTDAGSLNSSRPGGVLWPNTSSGSIRLVLRYNHTYTHSAQDAMRESLETSWGPTSADTSHASLNAGNGRDYESNGFGMQRKDFTK